MIELVEVTAQFFERGEKLVFNQKDKFWWENGAWKFSDREITSPEDLLIDVEGGEVCECDAVQLTFRFITNPAFYAGEFHSFFEADMDNWGIRELEDWTFFEDLIAIAKRLHEDTLEARSTSFIAVFDCFPNNTYSDGEPDGWELEVEFLGELDTEKLRGLLLKTPN